MTPKKLSLVLLWMGMTLSFISAAQNTKAVEQILHNSFRPEGVMGMEPITQDEVQAFCSNVKLRDSQAGHIKQTEMQKKNMDEIKPPSDGKFLGDWRSGEKIAQNGRGASWSDKPKTPNGGSCYNCHQIDPKEISFGTLGPSLAGYGKLRGNSEALVQYTWNRISNAKAYNACSSMPRFAHFQLLTEQQIKDVMALLLDPESPVNQ